MPVMLKCIPLEPMCEVKNIKLLQKFAVEIKRESLHYGEKTAAYTTCASRLSTKRSLNTKTHLAVAAHGMAWHAGPIFCRRRYCCGCSVTESLIAEFQAQYLLADRDYETDAIIRGALQAGRKPVIPPKKNRKLLSDNDKHIYKLWHLVENTFLHLKIRRGIATRYAKNVSSFVVAVQIRCIALLLKIYLGHGLMFFAE